MEVDNVENAGRLTENESTKRLALLKSLAQRGGGAKTKSVETKREKLVDEIEPPKRSRSIPKPHLGSIIEAPTENMPTSLKLHTNYEKKFETTPSVSKEIKNVKEHSNDDKRDTGNESTNDVEVVGIGKNTSESVGISERPERLSLQNMREQVWEVLHGMRRGTVTPQTADAFSRGCVTIMQMAKLEIDTLREFGPANEEVMAVIGNEKKGVLL